MIQKHKQGFTIIELLLAMSFISVLLLAIAMMAIQAGAMYNRGLTLKGVNSAGRNISDTIRRDFLQTDRRQVSAPTVNSAVISITSGVGDNTRTSGRFCLGGYSYLWNVPPANENAPMNNAVVGIRNATGPRTPINFVRVVDEGGNLCVRGAGPGGGYPIELPDRDLVTNLLKSKEVDGSSEVILGIYSITVSPVARASDSSPEGLYRVGFTIGTSRTSEIDTANQTCRPPSDSGSLEYCAVNNFEMIVRTNG